MGSSLSCMSPEALKEKSVGQLQNFYKKSIHIYFKKVTLSVSTL